MHVMVGKAAAVRAHGAALKHNPIRHGGCMHLLPYALLGGAVGVADFQIPAMGRDVL